MRLLSLTSLSFAALAAASCPTVTFFGVSYPPSNPNDPICRYADIRFASPPVGKHRFAAPEYPPQVPAGWENPRNPACIAMDISRGCVPVLPGDGVSCTFPSNNTYTEDCLFLDIYAPQAVINGKTKVPVVTWFHGGGYIYGSKAQADFTKLPLYDGRGPVEAADGNLVFVASNYRLGAFGWLAGSYMEKNGQPNAGLLDQRAALQFVHDQIHAVNGDASQVVAWGESAGASSLLHHITMPQNVKAPLFRRALLQSPAYQWMWNRTGELNDTFNQFAANATCNPSKSSPMECLRKLPVNAKALVAANQGLYRELACEGIFPVGPSVDGNLVPDIATNILSGSDNFVQLDSIIVSHVADEIPYPGKDANSSFIPYPILKHPDDPSYYNAFLNNAFNGDAYISTRSAIGKQYPTGDSDQIARAQQTIQDSSFLCHARAIIDAYLRRGTPVYAMNYAWLHHFHRAVHASDLLPTFRHAGMSYKELYKCLLQGTPLVIAAGFIDMAMDKTAAPFQSYLVSHARSGDPNRYAKGLARDHSWSRATTTTSAQVSYVTNVMQPEYPFDLKHPLAPFDPFDDNAVLDQTTNSAVCGFWKAVSRNIMDAYKRAEHSSETAAGENVGHTSESLENIDVSDEL